MLVAMKLRLRMVDPISETHPTAHSYIELGRMRGVLLDNISAITDRDWSIWKGDLFSSDTRSQAPSSQYPHQIGEYSALALSYGRKLR